MLACRYNATVLHETVRYAESKGNGFLQSLAASFVGQGARSAIEVACLLASQSLPLRQWIDELLKVGTVPVKLALLTELGRSQESEFWELVRELISPQSTLPSDDELEALSPGFSWNGHEAELLDLLRTKNATLITRFASRCEHPIVSADFFQELLPWFAVLCEQREFNASSFASFLLAIATPECQESILQQAVDPGNEFQEILVAFFVPVLPQAEHIPLTEEFVSLCVRILHKEFGGSPFGYYVAKVFSQQMVKEHIVPLRNIRTEPLCWHVEEVIRYSEERHRCRYL